MAAVAAVPAVPGPPSLRFLELATFPRLEEPKEALLRESEDQIRGDLAKSEALRDEISTLLDKINAAHDDEIARQIKVYEKMRGSQAAHILSEMEMDTVVPILRGMRADKAAKILAAMTPRKAAAISERLNEDPAAELSR